MVNHLRRSTARWHVNNCLFFLHYHSSNILLIVFLSTNNEFTWATGVAAAFGGSGTLTEEQSPRTSEEILFTIAGSITFSYNITFHIIFLSTEVEKQCYRICDSNIERRFFLFVIHFWF